MANVSTDTIVRNPSLEVDSFDTAFGLAALMLGCSVDDLEVSIESDRGVKSQSSIGEKSHHVA